MRFDQLDDPAPPSFGPERLAEVRARAERYRHRRRQRAIAIGSTVTGVAAVTLAVVLIAGHDSSGRERVSPAGGSTAGAPAGPPAALGRTPLPPTPLPATAEASEGTLFTSADGLIVCAFTNRAVTCELRSPPATFFRQPHSCPNDLAFLTLTEGGSQAQVGCVPDTEPNFRTMTPLPPAAGQTRFSFGSLTCSTTIDTVTCRDSRSTAGFELNKSSYLSYPSS